MYDMVNGDVQSEREEEKGSMGMWLFDCGEATQLSIQKTTSIEPGILYGSCTAPNATVLWFPCH